MSPNQGQVWNQMLGDIGNPLIFDTRLRTQRPTSTRSTARPPTAPRGGSSWPCPNATGNAAEDAVYEGWLYAIVATPAGALDGIFVTKDFGQNWTEVSIPTEPNEGYRRTRPFPPTTSAWPTIPIIGSALFPQGNYNRPSPSTRPIPASSTWAAPRTATRPRLIRVNLTDIWDAHSLVAYSYDANDGGQLNLTSTGPATVADNVQPDGTPWTTQART